MDVDGCRSVQSGMVTAKNDLQQRSTEVKSQVDSMVGTTFIAPSAEQLKGEVETWYGKMAQLLEEFQVLSDRFNREIAEFETTASQLSS